MLIGIAVKLVGVLILALIDRSQSYENRARGRRLSARVVQSSAGLQFLYNKTGVVLATFLYTGIGAVGIVVGFSVGTIDCIIECKGYIETVEHCLDESCSASCVPVRDFVKWQVEVDRLAHQHLELNRHAHTLDFYIEVDYTVHEVDFSAYADTHTNTKSYELSEDSVYHHSI